MNNPYQAPSGDISNQVEGHEYVGFWMRVVMAIVDSILLMVVMFPVLMLFGMNMEALATGTVSGLAVVVQYLLPAILYIGFWSMKGATPAKMLFKVKIIDEQTGENPSTGKSILRYIMYIVSSIPIGLGLAWVGWDKKKQGWHDKVAGTVVVKR